MSQLNQNSIALEELKTMAASLPAAITIDTTLTQSGKAADAKAVGDKFANHTQAASTITAGTLAGQVRGNATAMATVGNAQLRDIHAGMTDLTAGVSALATGTLYFVYE